MKKVKLSFNFTRLWNTEYPLFIERMVEIVSKNNPEHLGLKKAYDRLNALVPELKNLQTYARASSITDSITAVDKKRDHLIGGLTKIVSGYKLIDLPNYSDSAKKLYLSLSKYSKGFSKENYTSQTEKTKQFLEETNKNAEVSNAITNLNLSHIVTELKNANEEFERLFRSRTEEISSRPNVDVKALRAKIDDAANKLFAAIEFSITEYEDRDYTPLVSQLTELLNYHKAQIKARGKKKETASKEK